jgi:hypothetical protein
MPHDRPRSVAHRTSMSAERVILTFVGLCLVAFFIAVLVLPHHPPG